MSRTTELQLEDVKSRVREAGMRCTAARVAVMQHLDGAAGPRTHAEVSAALADRGFDRATIYRNLTELTEARLVTRVELGDHVWRFEARRRGHHGAAEDHPHFLCTTCGEVSCLDDVRLAITPHPRQRPADDAGGRKKQPRATDRSPLIHSVTEVLLKGRCGDCG